MVELGEISDPDALQERIVKMARDRNILRVKGYVAVKGGAQDCPYTYMTDLAAGKYRLPWEDEVKVTDGTGEGFPAPTRLFGEKTQEAAE